MSRQRASFLLLAVCSHCDRCMQLDAAGNCTFKQALLPELAELDHDAVPAEGRAERIMAAWQGSAPVVRHWRRLLSVTSGSLVMLGALCAVSDHAFEVLLLHAGSFPVTTCHDYSGASNEDRIDRASEGRLTAGY